MAKFLVRKFSKEEEIRKTKISLYWLLMYSGYSSEAKQYSNSILSLSGIKSNSRSDVSKTFRVFEIL